MTELLTSTFGVRGQAEPVPATTAREVDCVVLCGGLGTRLAGVVGDRPKTLADVGGRRFLEWLLLGLRRQGVTDVVLATGHGGDQVEATIGDGGHLGLRIRHSREPRPLGTAGALRHAAPLLGHDVVLVVNGDTYCDIDVRTLVAAHRASAARMTVLAAQVADRSRFGALEVAPDGRVTSFGEKQSSGAGLVSCGAYVLNREVVDRLPAGIRLDLERDVFPGWDPGSAAALVADGPFLDIGTPESYELAAAFIEQRFRPAAAAARARELGHVRAHLDRTATALALVAEHCSASIVDAAELVAATFTAGGKVLLCGNGGSAADCQHIAAEFVSRLDRDFDRAGLPAVALTTDSSFLTAYANDVDFDGVFARQVEALGRHGDVLVAISTSGASGNVARAVDAARRRRMTVIGIFGEGAPLAGAVDVAVLVPSRTTAVVQECMLSVEHSICEVVEQVMYGSPALTAAAGQAPR